MSPLDKLSRILGKAITWAFSGALYGGFFSGLFGYLVMQQGAASWNPYLIASLVSGTVIAAFFGSMLVALGGTLTGILTAISYQILFATYHQPLLLLGSAFLLGMVAGTFFTRREIHESQPLAQAAAGLAGGLAAGPILFLVARTLELDEVMAAISALSVSLVGLFYVVAIKHLPGILRQGAAEKIGGPLVSGIIAAAVAAVFWLIGESYMVIPLYGQESSYQAILDNTPFGLLGGALGGAFGGAMLEILGIRLEEHIT
jgi:hypothetical protein